MCVCWIIVAEISSLGAPPPCEVCAVGQGAPPPPGVACRARRGIAANRSRRGAAAAVRSVPVPPWGEARHLCTRVALPPAHDALIALSN